MEQKDEYIGKMKAKLDEFSAEIDRLEAEAAKKKAQGTAAYHERLAELKGHRENLKGRLAELKSDSGDAWQEIQAGADRLMDDFKDTFEKARDALR